MKEYIERDRLIWKVSARSRVYVDAIDYSDLYDLIRAIPAADVVPVVRCGECRYAYDSVGGWCCSHGICVDCIVREDFFCADGVRKDGDGA